MNQRLTPAETAIAAFGGVHATARALLAATGEEVYPSTVSRWQGSGTIPSRWHRLLLLAAQNEGVELTPEHLVLGKEAA